MGKIFRVLLLVPCAILALRLGAVTVTPKATDEALVNPGMGMVYYHHSNRLWAYGLHTRPGDTLDWFPGTSVAYLRVLWSDLEPEEGDFRWDLFDALLQNWAANGKQVAFRIICCNQTENATPDWVRDAGAKGIWFKYLGEADAGPERWEPTYDDPVFLAKLERFLMAFAARYDGDPAVAFVDVGSFGLYGEGHTGRTAKLSATETERMAKLHMELYRKCLPKSRLVVSDDVAGSTDTAEKSPLMEWAHARGIGFRDDSLLCSPKGWYHAHWGRNAAAHRLPVVLETGHFNLCRKRGNWRKDRLLEAVVAHQASYFTIHGFPDEILEEHRREIREMNLRLGYRFELKAVEYADSVRAGEPFEIRSTWANVGVAPLPLGVSAVLCWSLVDEGGAVVWSVTDPAFDFAALEPRLEDGERPRTAVTRGRWGRHADILPWNDQVLEELRAEGRVKETSFDMLKPGVYRLCVSVGRANGIPVLALPLADGRARRYPIGKVTVSTATGDIIVVPDRPTAVERSAAEELADGIRRMTGTEPRIVSEDSAGMDGKRFYVGRTAHSRVAFGEMPRWKPDEVAVRSVADGIVLDGDPTRGPIYAVDTYLEDVCGVRWWTSTESDYPTLRDLPVKDVNIRHASPFKYRETYYLDALDPTFKVRLKGNVTSRTKYVKRQPARIAPEQGGDSALHFFPERKSAYHSNLVILPPSAHFATHPEWYSLVDGVRKPVQLCMTNPEMKAEYIRSIRKLLAAHPESDFIQVSQNDGRIACQCERCRAAEAEDGLSGLYLGFANDVAAAIEKDFPHVTIDTFAYRFTRKPPKGTRPRHNVTVRLCDIECAFNAPLADSPLNADFLADLKGWREIAAGRLYLWDYTTDFSACMIPHPNLHVLADNVRLFARSGALGVFAQGDATCRAGFMAPLMAWTMSHLLWKPEADGRRLVDEFLSGYYGRAAPHLRRALSVVEEGGRRAAERGEAVGCYHVNVNAFWTKEGALRFCDSIAAAVVAAENETVRRRVRREELSADLVRLLNWKSWELGPEDERQELLTSWEGRCREFGVESYREAFGADDFDRCVATLRKGLVPDGVNTPKRKP